MAEIILFASWISSSTLVSTFSEYDLKSHFIKFWKGNESHHMDIQTSKIELTKLILDIDDPGLIEKIRGLVTEMKGDFWDELSTQQKKEIELGIQQLDEGRGIPFKEVLEELS